MFSYCYSLKSINLGFLEGNSKWRIASYMFLGCLNLKEVNFPNINNCSLEISSYMFSKCTILTSVNLEGLKAENIIYINNMFSNCPNLTYINIQNLDTRKVIYLDNIFYRAEKKINIKYNESITDSRLKLEIEKIKSLV